MGGWDYRGKDFPGGKTFHTDRLSPASGVVKRKMSTRLADTAGAGVAQTYKPMSAPPAFAWHFLPVRMRSFWKDASSLASLPPGTDEEEQQKGGKNLK
jgi:hypothetical protein